MGTRAPSRRLLLCGIRLEFADCTRAAANRSSLAGNQLTGPIPDALGSLTALQWLYLNSNAISGTLPPSLGGLLRLSVLCAPPPHDLEPYTLGPKP